MMRRLVHAGLTAVCLAAAGALVGAQATATNPYKLGTFAQGNRTFVGLVLNDTVAVDLSKADASLPTDMKTLLERYDSVRSKLASIAASASATRPAHAYDISSLKTLPPLMPQNILNAAVNYVEHAKEMQGRSANDIVPPAENPQSIPGIWERKPGDSRHNPYVFMKPVGAVIGNGDSIRLPPGRDRVDWECELSIVVGRTATAVPVARARDYIAGFTLQNDVSDRGGRTDNRHGSDWFIGKGHDTFAPLGPYIVPKEFVTDPQKLGIKFTLSGKVMQDSSTERMTHNVYEMLSYVSHILTLRPGDIIATGSPAGVGAARNVFMKAGDTSVCTIEQIGTLTNPVAAAAPTTTSAVR
jgi:2-keto-4-pentenoate hydratase/2-oxohepta-3-ene-1,7-dioic acid hydratase in catechol pathway